MSEVSSDATRDKLSSVIAEYTCLRTEIVSRSRDQLVCVTASFLSIGAVITLVIREPEKFVALLGLAPCLLLVMGIVWCDHAHAVHLIAVYLREEVEQKKLPALLASENDRYIGWESWLQERRDTSLFLGYINFVIPLLYFAAPALLALLAYRLIRSRSASILPVEIEASFLLLTTVLFVTLVFSWWRARRLT